jgi:ketosteroid isomerase-like protein
MSEENVEMVREAWEAWTKGDPGALSLLDPQVVYEDDMLPDHAGETYHGPEGLLRAWARWTEPWETFETDLEWARDAGDEVVSCHRARARGKGSGVDMEGRYAYVWRFKGKKVIHLKSYGDVDEALEAAGLSE